MQTTTYDVGDTIALASTLSPRLRDFLSPLLVPLDPAPVHHVVYPGRLWLAIFRRGSKETPS